MNKISIRISWTLKTIFWVWTGQKFSFSRRTPIWVDLKRTGSSDLRIKWTQTEIKWCIAQYNKNPLQIPKRILTRSLRTSTRTATTRSLDNSSRSSWTSCRGWTSVTTTMIPSNSWLNPCLRSKSNFTSISSRDLSYNTHSQTRSMTKRRGSRLIELHKRS